MPTELPPRPFDSPQPINPSASLAVSGFLARVHAWMVGGLLTTALAAYVVLSSPAIFQAIYGNRIVFYGLLFAELGLVAWLSGMVGRLSSGAATLVFLLYAALNGLTMAGIFLIYTSGSVVSTFFVAAGMFGATSVYGLVTKREL